MYPYTTTNFITSRKLLTSLANLFANGDLSYAQLTTMLNQSQYKVGKKQNRELIPEDVRSSFKRIYTYAGVDTEPFPFLYITPKQVLKLENLLTLKDASPNTFIIKHRLSKYDYDRIVSGDFSFPVRLNVDDEEEYTINPEVAKDWLASHKNVTGHKKEEIINVGGHEINITSFSPIGKKVIHEIMGGSLPSPKTLRCFHDTEDELYSSE